MPALPTQSNLSAVVKDDADPKGQSIRQMLSAHNGTAVILDENGCAWYAPLIVVIDIERACSQWEETRLRTIRACARAWERGRKDISDRMNIYAGALNEYAPTWKPTKEEVLFSR